MPSTRCDAVFLVGMMGAGKSAVGERLAAAMGRRFVDLDVEIERQAGRSIAALFESDGEAAFRAREAAALRALALDDVVVSTGGGTVTRAESLTHMRENGRVVYLRAKPETLHARVRDSIATRPLLAHDPLQALTSLLAARKDAYEAAHTIVDTDALSIDDVVTRIHDRATINVPMPASEGGAYDAIVYRGADGVAALHDVAARFAGRRCVLLADPALGAHIHDVALALDASLVEVSGGEGSKQLSAIEALAGTLVELGVDRSSVLFALGGGALGDAVGFLAATFLRGVEYVHLPTTLLSMVDSSIGGKTAVNLSAGKNLLGAFHQPRLVFADLAWLTTLSARDRAAGLGEVLKHALLEGEDALCAIERDADALANGPTTSLFDVVCNAIAYKARVVAADPRERTPRGPHGDLADGAPSSGRITLNLGHTIGHALERASHEHDAQHGKDPLRHGEAVALGLLAEAQIAAARGLWPDGPRRIAALLPRLGLTRTLTDTVRKLSLTVVRDALSADKKKQAGALRFVLLTAPGQPVSVRLDGGEAVEMLRAQNAQ